MVEILIWIYYLILTPLTAFGPLNIKKVNIILYNILKNQERFNRPGKND